MRFVEFLAIFFIAFFIFNGFFIARFYGAMDFGVIYLHLRAPLDGVNIYFIIAFLFSSVVMPLICLLYFSFNRANCILLLFYLAILAFSIGYLTLISLYFDATIALLSQQLKMIFLYKPEVFGFLALIIGLPIFLWLAPKRKIFLNLAFVAAFIFAFGSIYKEYNLGGFLFPKYSLFYEKNYVFIDEIKPPTRNLIIILAESMESGFSQMQDSLDSNVLNGGG